MLTLYDSPLSPFCRKVRMVIELKGLAFDAITESRAEDWGRFNRRAEIPILLHDELVVLNSADIVSYLDEAFPQAPVLPRDPAAGWSRDFGNAPPTRWSTPSSPTWRSGRGRKSARAQKDCWRPIRLKSATSTTIWNGRCGTGTSYAGI
jgi:hypothetical protein